MLYAGVIFFLVLQYLRPQEFVPLIRGLRLVFWTMLLLIPPWIATLQSKKLLRTPIDLFMLFLYAVAVASWWNYWKSHMYLPAQEFGRVFLCYLFVAHVIDTRHKLVGALWATMLMLLLVALMAGQDVGLKNQYASIGIFNNRNDFAYAMAIMLPIGLAFVLRGDPFSKIVGAGVVLVGLVEVFSTDSRGGQLASLFAIGAAAHVLAKSKLARTAMLVVGVACLMFAFWYSSRLQSVADYRSDKSAMGRVEVWAQCLTMFKQHRFLGWGYQTWDDLPKTPRDTHNSYMRALVEIGGLGLFAYVGLLFFALREAYRLTQRDVHPSLRMAATAMTGILVGQIAGGLFQTRVYHLIVLVQIAFVSALRLVADRERAERAAAALPAEGPATGETDNLWLRSLRPGLWSPGLITRKDLLKVGAFTFLCWLAHKIFVMRSF